MPHVQGMAQIGIRGLGSSRKEDFEAARAYGSVIVTMRELRALGVAGVLERIPAAERYYVTIDIDGIDPSIAPGTGTPSPGGLSYEEARDLLEGLAAKGEVVGFDLVEVAPPYDQGDLTALLAANIAYEFICLAAVARQSSQTEA